MPPLAVAYAATALAPRLALAPSVSSWILLALLVGRTLPIAALVLALLPPPPLSGSGAHVFALLPARAPLRRHRTRLRALFLAGASGTCAFAFAVGFVVAFADFELTARFGQASWTVWLFDAQAGGVDVGALVQQAVLPAALALSVLGLAGAHALRVGAAPRPRAASRPPPRSHISPYLPLVAALALTVVLPLALLVRDGASHLDDAVRSRAARGELSWSIGYAAAAAALATWVAHTLAHGRKWAWLAMALACVPGSAGSLTLALVTRHICPDAAADTPLPALAALTFAALPIAVALRLALARPRHDSPTQTARLLAPLDARRRRVAAAIASDLAGHPALWSFAMLVPLVLQDVVIGAILAPPHAAPLTVRLHNLAHYGHSHTVSAQLLLLVVTGVLPAAVIAGAARIPAGKHTAG
ncbi:MAG: hypothetical protein R3F56_25755 [Planctomycetota bacterium]